MAGNGGWQQWLADNWQALAQTGAAAYAGYQGAQSQNDYVAAASGPQPFNRTDVTEAHPAAFSYLEGLFPQIQQQYAAAQARQQSNPMPTYQPNGGGGGGGGNRGVPAGQLDWGGSSQPTQDVRQALVDRAMGGSQFVDQAQQQALGMMQNGAGSNPMLDQAFAAASQQPGTDPNLQRFINQGFRGGYDDSSGYMQQFLQGLMGGQSPPPGAPPQQAGAPQQLPAPQGASPAAPMQKPTPGPVAPQRAPATQQSQTWGGPSAAQRTQSTAGNAAAALAAQRGRFAEGSPQRAQLEAKISEAQAGTQPAIRSGASYAIDQGVGSGGAGNQQGIDAYKADQAAQAQAAPAAPPPQPSIGTPMTSPPPPQDVQNKSYGGQYDNPLFNLEIEKLLNGHYLDESNPHTQKVLANLREQSNEATNLQTAQLDAQSEGAGRYGSGLYQNMRGNIAASGQQSYDNASANLLMQQYEAERQRMLGGAGLLSSRDQAVWGDKTSREGIDASRDAAMAAAGSAGRASANANATQLELQQNQLDYDRWAAEQGFGLQRQGLTLDAINSYSGNELGAAGLLGGAVGQGAGLGSADRQFGLGLMGQLGSGAADRDLATRMGALSSIPGLNQAGYYGLESALSGSAGVDQLDTQAAQAGSSAQVQQQLAQQQLAGQRAGQRGQQDMAAYQSQLRAWEDAMNRPGQDFQAQLQQMLALSGGLGSVSQSSGQSTGAPPGPTANPWAGAIQYGLGTWMSRPPQQQGG